MATGVELPIAVNELRHVYFLLLLFLYFIVDSIIVKWFSMFLQHCSSALYKYTGLLRNYYEGVYKFIPQVLIALITISPKFNISQ